MGEDLAVLTDKMKASEEEVEGVEVDSDKEMNKEMRAEEEVDLGEEVIVVVEEVEEAEVAEEEETEHQEILKP